MDLEEYKRITGNTGGSGLHINFDYEEVQTFLNKAGYTLQSHTAYGLIGYHNNTPNYGMETRVLAIKDGHFFNKKDWNDKDYLEYDPIPIFRKILKEKLLNL